MGPGDILHSPFKRREVVVIVVDDEEDGNPKSTCRYVSIFFQLQSHSVLILTPIQELNIVIRRYRSHESQSLFSEDIY